MLLNLESRLAQRVLIEVARAPTATRTTSTTLGRAASPGRTGSRRARRCASTPRRSAARCRASTSRRCASRTRVCDRMRDEPASGRASTPRGPTCRSSCTSAPSAPRSTSTARARRSSSAAGARTRATRRSRRRSPPRCSPPPAGAARAEGGGAARPVLRLRHDRDRGRADRDGHRAGPAAPLRLRAPAAVPRRTRRARWQRLQIEGARARIARRAVPIFASDVSFRMVDFARRNAERAGVAACDRLQRRRCARAAGAGVAGRAARHADGQPALRRADRRQGRAAGQAPTRARGAAPSTRPRRRDRDSLPAPGARTGSTPTPPHPAGWTAWILSPDMRLPSAMRLKESRRVPMWNGPIECRLFRFDLVAGSARGGNSRPRRLVTERLLSVRITQGARSKPRQRVVGGDRFPGAVSHTSQNDPIDQEITMSFKLSTPLLAALALTASFTALSAHAADLPGKHPAYLHALTDLRAARWNLEHRAGDAAVSAQEDVAIVETDRAIHEARTAAMEDGKNVEDHPQEDAAPRPPGPPAPRDGAAAQGQGRRRPRGRQPRDPRPAQPHRAARRCRHGSDEARDPRRRKGTIEARGLAPIASACCSKRLICASKPAAPYRPAGSPAEADPREARGNGRGLLVGVEPALRSAQRQPATRGAGDASSARATRGAVPVLITKRPA